MQSVAPAYPHTAIPRITSVQDLQIVRGINSWRQLPRPRELAESAMLLSQGAHRDQDEARRQQRERGASGVRVAAKRLPPKPGQRRINQSPPLEHPQREVCTT